MATEVAPIDWIAEFAAGTRTHREHARLLVLRSTSHARSDHPSAAPKGTPIVTRDASSFIRHASDRQQRAPVQTVAHVVDTSLRRTYQNTPIVPTLVWPATQAKLREKVVVKGDKGKAVSELAEGRRTIVPDADEPAMEANLLDSLMVSRAEEFAAELEAVYMPVGTRAPRDRRRESSRVSGSSSHV